MNEIVLNKKLTIERCIRQIRAYYALDHGQAFETDYLKQDAIAMNLQRICESAIDIANHLIKIRKLGLPQNSAESFDLLHRAGLISRPMMQNMTGMVGFRNVLVHQYAALDTTIVQQVIGQHLCDPLDFANLALRLADEGVPDNR
ncbi:MAG: type VII toxin-antitoxin system HepT family RNase toxin [Gammaproteobacteria bacterium]